jgi:hypothetical protein
MSNVLYHKQSTAELCDKYNAQMLHGYSSIDMYFRRCVVFSNTLVTMHPTRHTAMPFYLCSMRRGAIGSMEHTALLKF